MFLAAAFGLAIYAFAIRASARLILKDVSAIRVGVSTVADVEALAAPPPRLSSRKVLR